MDQPSQNRQTKHHTAVEIQSIYYIDEFAVPSALPPSPFACFTSIIVGVKRDSYHSDM